MVVREQLMAALAGARDRVSADLKLEAEVPAEVRLSVPPGADAADFSSDLALDLARQARQPAAEVARALVEHLEPAVELVERLEITPSGLVNFHLRSGWVREGVREACRQGARYGRSGETAEAQRERIQVEFVSANPTGPLTVGHGRGAALGDAIANLLEWTGRRVTRESYVNDTGKQIERFGQALEAAYRRRLGEPLASGPAADDPAGEYAAEIADRIHTEAAGRCAGLPAEECPRVLAELGSERVLADHRAVLERFGVRIDEWRSEADLLASGKLEEAIRVLRENGCVYEADGALWLRATATGDTEDRPLIRSNGQPAYLAGDLAYHLDKFSRGFHRVIDIWGPHHAEYVRRTQAGVRALGCDADALEIIVFQPVSVKIEGVVVHSGEGGARAGNNLLLDQVIEKAGRGTLRFLYLSRPAGQPLELDLDALEGTSNPAYSVLRAYEDAEVCAGSDSAAGAAAADVDLGELTDPREESLMRRLADFPDEVALAARERDPARLTRFALETAQQFEAFRALLESRPEAETMKPAHAAVARATRVVLGNALAILGIVDQE